MEFLQSIILKNPSVQGDEITKLEPGLYHSSKLIKIITNSTTLYKRLNLVRNRSSDNLNLKNSKQKIRASLDRWSLKIDRNSLSRILWPRAG